MVLSADIVEYVWVAGGISLTLIFGVAVLYWLVQESRQLDRHGLLDPPPAAPSAPEAPQSAEGTPPADDPVTASPTPREDR